jgi:hypothetical protein
MDGSTAIGTGTLNSGKATFTTSSLSVGSHAITAVYGGDVNFTTSTSTAVSQGVNQANTTTALVSSLNPSVFGQSVTFTATVTAVAPGSGTPTGTVTFYDGSTKLGTGTLGGGVASFTTASLAVGSHSIKAVYGGDTNFKTSTSAILTQVVESSGSGGSALGAIDQGPAVSAAATTAAPAVDFAIAALKDDDPSSGSLVHDLALDQVSTRARRGTIKPTD